MSSRVETFTPPNTPRPIGPYNHIAKVGQFITIGGTAGVDPATGDLAGTDVYSQTKQILESFKVMLESVGSDLSQVLHVNIFLKNMQDFENMNRGYIEKMGEHLPARTVFAVKELPKPGVLLTMNLTAVTKEQEAQYNHQLCWDEVDPRSSIPDRIMSIHVGDWPLLEGERPVAKMTALARGPQKPPKGLLGKLKDLIQLSVKEMGSDLLN